MIFKSIVDYLIYHYSWKLCLSYHSIQHKFMLSNREEILLIQLNNFSTKMKQENGNENGVTDPTQDLGLLSKPRESISMLKGPHTFTM